MKFSLSLSFLALASPVAGFDGSISTDSKLGQNLLGKARQLENENNYYAYSWISGGSLKFQGCESIPMFERDEGLRANMVAKFKICPNESCGSCRGGGEYVVELRDFVETYQQAIQEAQEYECETNKEACEYNCENGVDYSSYASGYSDDDNYCLNACLTSKGSSFCIEDEQEQMDMEEFGECRAMNEEDQNNNNYNYGSDYQVYYTGAYCTSSGVYAGVFTDSTCSKHAPKGTYETYNYGYSLPTEPLVSNDCISCASYNNDDANNNNGGVNEVCAELYEQALKCERHVKSDYKDTSGCEMMHKVIPKLSKAMNNLRGRPSASTVFAWIFGLGFFALAGYLYRLHKKTGVALDIPGTGYTLE